MKCSDEVQVYIELSTTSGTRYLFYTPVDYDNGGTGTYVHHGLGSEDLSADDIKNGRWHTFGRSLLGDLKEFQPNADIESVDGLYILGSARIDDIQLRRVYWDIHYPFDGAIFNHNHDTNSEDDGVQILVKGKTDPNTNVLITAAANEETTTEADPSGNFENEITLNDSADIYVIEVSQQIPALPDETQQRTIYYDRNSEKRYDYGVDDVLHMI